MWHATVHALHVSLNVSRLRDGHKASPSGCLTKTSCSWGPRRPELCDDSSPTLHTCSPTPPNKHSTAVTNNLAKPVTRRPFPPSADCPATAKIRKGKRHVCTIHVACKVLWQHDRVLTRCSRACTEGDPAPGNPAVKQDSSALTQRDLAQHTATPNNRKQKPAGPQLGSPKAALLTVLRPVH